MKPILLLALISAFTYAQPTIEWQKSYGGPLMDYALSQSQTTDGGYIIVGGGRENGGNITGSHGNYDVWVVKLDGFGNLQWQKSCGSTAGDYAQFVQQTTDGGYIIAGESGGNGGDVTGFNGGGDFWIIKLDVDGTLLWQKSLGTSGWDAAFSIIETSDGGFIAAGVTTSNGGDVSGFHGGVDGWIVKLSSVGTIEWQKALGGSEVDFIPSVRQTPDGGYIVAGETTSTDGDVTGNHGNMDFLVIKLSSAGVIEWQQCYGGSNNESANSIVVTADGGYIMVGSSSSNDQQVTENHGGQDIWVVKINSNGALQWQKSLGGSGSDTGRFIQQAPDGGYIICGHTASVDGDVSGNSGASDFWLVRLNSVGAIQWQKCMGGSSADYANEVDITSDGGYVVSGQSYSNDGAVTGNHGSSDYWIVKVAPDALSFAENAQISFTVSPNPVRDVMTISDSTTVSELAIYDSSGRCIYQKINPDNTLSLSFLKKGVYVVELKHPKGVFATKIIKD